MFLFFVCSTFVIAAVKVVLPWSMCPIVPMFTCGFVRSNFFFPMSSSPRLPRLGSRVLWSEALLAPDAGNDLLGDVGRHLVVVLQLHRCVRRAPLGARTQVGRVAEQLGERDQHPDRLLAAPVVDPLD